jgi:hypothetical protein
MGTLTLSDQNNRARNWGGEACYLSAIVSGPGTDVMIFKKISPKNSATKLAFLTQNKAKICKILILTLVFEKNANFFAENWGK